MNAEDLSMTERGNGMAARKQQRRRQGEVWVDCAAARHLYEDAKDRIPTLYKLLEEAGFGSGPLSRIRGVSELVRGPKAATKMLRAGVETFARISEIPIEQLLVGGTGLHPPSGTESNAGGPTVQLPASSEEPPFANAARRAWIRIVRAEIASPLIFTAGDWGRLAVKLRLGNAGDAPASFVTTASTIIPFEAELSPRAAMGAMRDQQPSEGQGFTLFPGEERDWFNGVVMDPGAVRRVKETLADQKVYVLFAGCVSYRSAGNRTIHKTPYLYEVYQTINAELVGFDFVESVIDPGRLSLHPEARWLLEPT
jgi:hypothetical protein